MLQVQQHFCREAGPNTGLFAETTSGCIVPTLWSQSKVIGAYVVANTSFEGSL